MTVRDSDFFIRSKSPSLTQFTSYRSSNVMLFDELTGIDHLNLFAHLKSNQKMPSTKLLFEHLLGHQNKKVKFYSEGQRQCLQTLIALCSETSRLILLDEPTRGLDTFQRKEIIRAIWRFKKDRYIVINSSDNELISMLSDSIAKVLPDGLEILQ